MPTVSPSDNGRYIGVPRIKVDVPSSPPNQIIPRMLRQTTHRDLTTEFFGEKHDSPVFIAPVGVQSIFHHDKEIGVAEIAAEIGVPYILSTAASSTIEEVAKANGNGRRWYQLYWPQVSHCFCPASNMH